MVLNARYLWAHGLSFRSASVVCVCVRVSLPPTAYLSPCFFKFGHFAIFRLPSEVNIFGWNILAGEIEGKVRSVTVHEGPEGE